MKNNIRILENLKRMEKFFVKELGFESIDGENIYEDKTIECELYLVNRENNTRIYIVKHFNEEEIDFTMQGRPEIANQYNTYISRYVNTKSISN